MQGTILSIDPGKFRSGIAVLDGEGSVVEKVVVRTLVLAEEILPLCQKYSVGTLLIGSGGPGRMIEKKILSMDLSAAIVFVNEKGSTLEARKLYWEEHPPNGLLRLLPRSLLVPREPYDDHAAVVIGRRYLKGCRK